MTTKCNSFLFSGLFARCDWLGYAAQRECVSRHVGVVRSFVRSFVSLRNIVLVRSFVEILFIYHRQGVASRFEARKRVDRRKLVRLFVDNLFSIHDLVFFSFSFFSALWQS
jgi:hypothetical protein